MAEMPPARVRWPEDYEPFGGDYDQLKKISAMFVTEWDACDQTIARLSAVLSELRSGDWIGEGADGFYKEMDSQVMRSMRRLRETMGIAGDSTKAIAQRIKQAEQDTSGVFNP